MGHAAPWGSASEANLPLGTSMGGASTFAPIPVGSFHRLVRVLDREVPTIPVSIMRSCPFTFDLETDHLDPPAILFYLAPAMRASVNSEWLIVLYRARQT